MTDIVERLRIPKAHCVGKYTTDLEHEAADEIERLRVLTEWQPMETAPKDGTYILLLIPPDEFEGGEAYWIEGWHSSRTWRTRDHVSANPIGWANLPVSKGKP